MARIPRPPTVSLNVTPVNDAPVGTEDQFTVKNNQALLLTTADLLANDFDIEGSPLQLTIASSPTGGNLIVSGSLLIYAPKITFFGTAHLHLPRLRRYRCHAG